MNELAVHLNAAGPVLQSLAAHSNPRTTQIYDRRRRRVTRNIVAGISI